VTLIAASVRLKTTLRARKKKINQILKGKASNQFMKNKKVNLKSHESSTIANNKKKRLI
jgi:hypothetical protein